MSNRIQDLVNHMESVKRARKIIRNRLRQANSKYRKRIRLALHTIIEETPLLYHSVNTYPESVVRESINRFEKRKKNKQYRAHT